MNWSCLIIALIMEQIFAWKVALIVVHLALNIWQKFFYSYSQNQWINRRKSSRIKGREMNWSSCCTFKILRTKKNSYKFLKIHNGKLYKCTVHLSICELEKYILGVSHLRHSITDIYYLALESYSLKFCYARHASFYSILYLILSTTELLYSKSLNNTTLQCK